MKNSLLVVLCFLLLLLTVVQGRAQTSNTGSGVNESLSNNSVWVMMQDSRGVMWIGTKEGLNAYNGYYNTIYKNDPADSLSLRNSFIRSILEVVPGKEIWVGTGEGISIYHMETDRFTRFSATTEEGLTPEAPVNSMVRQGDKIWISEVDVGIYCYDMQTRQMEFYSRTSFPWSLCIDSYGTLWTAAFSAGVYRFIPAKNDFEYIAFPEGPGMDDAQETRSFFEDLSNDCLWVGTLSSGLMCYDYKTGRWRAFQTEASQELLHGIYAIVRYSSSELAVGTEQGLYLFNTVTQKFRLLASLQSIFSLVQDKEGGIWVGTYYDGVHYLRPGFEAVSQHTVPPQTGRVISSILSASDKDYLWIGARDDWGGFCSYNKTTGEYTDYSDVVPYRNVRELASFDDQLWIGYYADGLVRLNTLTGSVKHYTHRTDDTTSLSHNAVYTIYKTTRDVIYIGTILGLDIFDPVTERFTRVSEIGNTRIHSIVEDYLGLVWVATYQEGLYCYNPATGEWRSFRHSHNEGALPSDCLISLHTDKQHRLFIGTEGAGLCQYNYESSCFDQVVSYEGLSNGIICGILSDHKGNLWISQSRSISYVDMATKQVYVLDESVGMEGYYYCYNGIYEDADGVLYFGHANGFMTVNPDQLHYNTLPPTVMITGVHNGQNDVRYATSGPIVVAPRTPSIRFDFVALSYSFPTRNSYTYYLEGYEDPWSHSGTEPFASYINLPPGSYVFYVKGANSDGVWNETPLSVPFRVKAILWRRPYMIVFYVLLLVGAFSMAVKLPRRTQKRRMESEMLHYQMEKDKELYSRQVQFFTNIIHEIRTPLSLIKAPLESIINALPPTESRENYDIMERNVERLHSLADQILDYRKIEQNVYVSNIKPYNLAPIIQSVAFRYKSSCRLRNITLTVSLSDDPVICMVDSEALTKILSNLLSNALKYAKSAITISMIKGPKGGVVKVFDDGAAIPVANIDKIFMPFYRVNDEATYPGKEGTGIGLALVKQLVDLQKASIEVSSVPDNTTFTIILPYGTAAKEAAPLQGDLLDYPAEAMENAPEDERYQAEEQPFANTLLIVEDNYELLNFLQINFGHMYNVVTAVNGKEALARLEESAIIDVIITDILMPVMDGVELCRAVRANPMLCHIPIILLTAQTDIRSKTHGLDYGADVFIEKPFSLEFLKAQVPVSSRTETS